MNEVASSVKLFEKTARELSSLQQRLESVYEDMGHKLGKYYEISEGNAFGAERAKAIAGDDDEFTVDGKKFPVKSVDKEDEENAEEFTESVNLRSIFEGASNEEKKIALSAIKRLAKYRSIDLGTAATDTLRAVKELESDIEKGKIK
jgi:hypothetical protein